MLCYEVCTDEFLDRAKSATFRGLHESIEVEEVDEPMDDVTGDVLRLLNGLDPEPTTSVRISLIL